MAAIFGKLRRSTSASSHVKQERDETEPSTIAPNSRSNSKARTLPVEIIVQILRYLDVPTFLLASTISKAWHYSSNELVLLRDFLTDAGWSTDKSITACTDVRYLKQRLQLEYLLGMFRSGRVLLDLLSITDVAKVVAINTISSITTSNCQKFFMVCADDKATHITRFCSITCPRPTIAVSMDTKTDKISIAVLMTGRMGLALSIGHGNPSISSVYRNVCMYDDPPTSVAICSSRRCVAYGCRAGIELHWIDPESGEQQNRWFPMHSPSDFLYFVPLPESRSANKQVRLVSSAANPGVAMASVVRPLPSRGIYTVWNDLARRHHYHFQAIPLSDGNYVMFIDQSTMNLCLGCDLPLRDPAKRSARITLQGPTYRDSGEDDNFEPVFRVVPCLYAAAPMLDKGIRVCAVYNDDLYLFSIPPDLLRNISPPRLPDSINSVPVFSQYREETMLFKQINDYTILGSKIGTVHKTVNIAISTEDDGRVHVYAFSALGSIYTFAVPSSNFSGSRYVSIPEVDVGQAYGLHDNPHETHFVIRGDGLASQQMDGLVEFGNEWSWHNDTTIKVPDDYYNMSYPVIDIEVFDSTEGYRIATVLNTTSSFLS